MGGLPDTFGGGWTRRRQPVSVITTVDVLAVIRADLAHENGDLRVNVRISTTMRWAIAQDYIETPGRSRGFGGAAARTQPQ